MDEINKLIHEPSRLRIMGALMGLEADAEVDFTFLRNQLNAYRIRYSLVSMDLMVKPC